MALLVKKCTNGGTFRALSLAKIERNYPPDVFFERKCLLSYYRVARVSDRYDSVHRTVRKFFWVPSPITRGMNLNITDLKFCLVHDVL